MKQLKKILTSNSILINRIASLLNDNGIPTLVKDVGESARVAGFGAIADSTELFVDEENVERAKRIIDELDSEN